MLLVACLDGENVACLDGEKSIAAWAVEGGGLLLSCQTRSAHDLVVQ